MPMASPALPFATHIYYFIFFCPFAVALSLILFTLLLLRRLARLPCAYFTFSFFPRDFFLLARTHTHIHSRRRAVHCEREKCVQRKHHCNHYERLYDVCATLNVPALCHAYFLAFHPFSLHFFFFFSNRKKKLFGVKYSFKFGWSLFASKRSYRMAILPTFFRSQADRPTLFRYVAMEWNFISRIIFATQTAPSLSPPLTIAHTVRLFSPFAFRQYLPIWFWSTWIYSEISMNILLVELRYVRSLHSSYFEGGSHRDTVYECASIRHTHTDESSSLHTYLFVASTCIRRAFSFGRDMHGLRFTVASHTTHVLALRHACCRRAHVSGKCRTWWE